MNDQDRGMHRVPDHRTSILAAGTVLQTRDTLKSRVMQFARDAGPAGFIDEELVKMAPDRPESSLRKRRTELTAANWIIGTGRERKNSHNQAVEIFVHRDHCFNPPPVGTIPGKTKESAAQAERAAVVKYLRTQGDARKQGSDPSLGAALHGYADMIERGDHLQ